MGYDLVTWNPRVGATGDDQYTVPDDTGVHAGDSAGYSTVPTISEINAGSGWNQVIALIRRRIGNYNNAYGTAITLPSYLAQDGKILASHIQGADLTNAVYPRIKALRALEGFSAYTLPTAEVSSGLRILGTHIAEARKALRIAGIVTLPNRGPTYVRVDNPYLTPSTETLSETPNPLASRNSGKQHIGGTSVRRTRNCPMFPIPEWVQVGSFTSNGLDFTIVSFSTTVEAFTFKLHRQNSDDWSRNLSPAFGGFAYHRDNEIWSIGSGSIAVQNYNFAIAETDIEAKVGGALCFIGTTEHEFNGTGSGAAALDSRVVASTALELDFGA